MRLPQMTSRIVDLLEQSRPRVGDVVATFDGERFIVEQCGMKYFVVHVEDNPNAKRWFRHSEVRKLEPEDAAPARDEESPGLLTSFSHIGPRD